jgi:hypothetical protein
MIRKNVSMSADSLGRIMSNRLKFIAAALFVSFAILHAVGMYQIAAAPRNTVATAAPLSGD